MLRSQCQFPNEDGILYILFLGGERRLKYLKVNQSWDPGSIVTKTKTQAPFRAGLFFLDIFAFLLISLQPIWISLSFFLSSSRSLSFLAYFSSHVAKLFNVFTSHHMFYTLNLRTESQTKEHLSRCLRSFWNTWLWLCTSLWHHLFLCSQISIGVCLLDILVLVQENGKFTSQCSSLLCPFVSPWQLQRVLVCWACVKSALWPSVICSA